MSKRLAFVNAVWHDLTRGRLDLTPRRGARAEQISLFPELERRERVKAAIAIFEKRAGRWLPRREED